MGDYCCDMMRENSTASCGFHDDPHECADVTVVWSEHWEEYGLPVRDGGSSVIEISFCPWCGTRVGSPNQQPPVGTRVWHRHWERYGVVIETGEDEPDDEVAVRFSDQPYPHPASVVKCKSLDWPLARSTS